MGVCDVLLSRRRDHLNARSVVGAGFEPANPFREPDLQSGAINHSAIPPRTRRLTRKEVYLSRARNGNAGGSSNATNEASQYGS